MSAYEEALNNCLQAKKRAEQRDATTVPVKYLFPGTWGTTVSSGVSVTPTSAMRTSAVWACINVLSRGMGALPLHILRESNGRREKAVDLPVYDILHRNPNPIQTAYTFRSLAMSLVCLYGNFYAEIEFDGWGNPIALWPIPPWRCEPTLSANERELAYQVTLPTGGQQTIAGYRILHYMGLSTDGFKGMSPIRQHAESIGISIAAEAFGASFFGHGANVGGIVEHPGHLSVEGNTKLEGSLNRRYGGLGVAHRIMLLEEGMKYTKIGIPPEEAQFLETRQFQVEDIARIYNVQLHKIQHLLHATFSNIEHQAIEFVTDTILPWAVNFEQENDRKLLVGRPGLYSKHSLEGLLRGDSAARAAFYRELWYIGALTQDEIREKEDWNPLPDGLGQRTFVPANMVPADKVDQYLASAKSAVPVPRASVSDVIKKIAQRDKENILRAYQKDAAGLERYLEDYYRDFSGYILKEIMPYITE